jgi:hypothetical protein
MPALQNRRRFLTTLSSAAAAGIFAGSNALAEETPLETTRIRLYDWAGVCIAPQFVAEELLKAEGFTDVQYLTTNQQARCRILYWPPAALTSTLSSLRRRSFASRRVIPSFFWAGSTSAASSCLGRSKFVQFAISRGNEWRYRRLGRQIIFFSPAWRPVSASTPAATSTS